MSRKLLFVIIAVLYVSNVGEGQVLQFGLCPEVETMKYFDLEWFLGQWFEVARFPAWYENYGKCAYKRIQYCGRRIEIEHVIVRDDIQYVLHMNSTYTPGDEAVFAIQENNIDPMGIPLHVISTDYINYAVVFGCRNNIEIGLKYMTAWILSRESTLPDQMLRKAYAELNTIPSANIAFLETVDQRIEMCKFYWTAHVHAVDTGRGPFLAFLSSRTDSTKYQIVVLVAMILFIFCLLISSAYCQIVNRTYTLVGDCSDFKLQENVDGTKFSGLWYNIASYTSDNRTVSYCTTMEFQEDNMGFTLRETYIDSSVENVNRSQNSFSARVDPTFDAGNRGKFIVSLGNGEKVLQFPVFILKTDYEDFAILYTCKSIGRKAKMHYMFVWVLTRSKEPLEGEHLQKIEKAISNYPELAENRSSFTFQDFSDAACTFKTKKEIDFSAGNFW